MIEIGLGIIAMLVIAIIAVMIYNAIKNPIDWSNSDEDLDN